MKWKTQILLRWESWDWWWISLESLIYIWWQMTQQVGFCTFEILRSQYLQMEPHFNFSILADGIWLLLVKCVSMSLAIFFKSYMEAADLSLLVTIEETVNMKALPHRALKFVFYELSTASGDLNKYIHFLRKVWGAGWKDEWNEPHQHIRPQVFFSPRIEWTQVILQANLKTNLGLKWYQSTTFKINFQEQ